MISNFQREKQRREQELAQAIEGLRGEWRDIVEGMRLIFFFNFSKFICIFRENFKSAELDMYEKSEGVQKILQKLLDDVSFSLLYFVKKLYNLTHRFFRN